MRESLAKKLKLTLTPDNKTELYNASNKRMSVSGWASVFIRAPHLVSLRKL